VKLEYSEKGTFKLQQLSDRFQQFSIECKGSSKLYELLSLHIAGEKEILRLGAYARSGQPIPNLLFGAVHYLLLKGIDHPLKDFYMSITKNPDKMENCPPFFTDFCSKYENEIIHLLQTKLVQTNEVRRCAYLYPAFCYIYELTKQPLALIEIGTSAGFQLLWDQYKYSYGTGEIYGNKNSNIHLMSEIKSSNSPFFFEEPPPVSHRIGTDLHINNVSNQDDYLWLMALIWPEHHDRRTMLREVAQVVNNNNLKLIQGDGITLIPKITEQVKDNSTLCIFHTHVANQFSHGDKVRLLDKIQKISRKRDVFHLYNNMFDGELHLDYIIDGKKQMKTIGKTEGHGNWFEWRINS